MKLPPPTGRCPLCGKRAAYEGAVFCGAAHLARWEGGQRPGALRRFFWMALKVVGLRSA